VNAEDDDIEIEEHDHEWAHEEREFLDELNAEGHVDQAFNYVYKNSDALNDFIDEVGIAACRTYLLSKGWNLEPWSTRLGCVDPTPGSYEVDSAVKLGLLYFPDELGDEDDRQVLLISLLMSGLLQSLAPEAILKGVLECRIPLQALAHTVEGDGESNLEGLEEDDR